MYGDLPGEESVYLQLAGVSSTPAFQQVYWKCVALFFASSRRHNPGCHHILFTNLEIVPEIEGFDLAGFLEGLGVEVVQLPLTFSAPEGYYGAWRNQFYVFDAIQHLAERVTDEDYCLLLDSDCLWVRDAHDMITAIDREGVLTYDIGLRPGWPQNDLTREEMGRIYAELLPEKPIASPAYIGGELFAATGRETKQVAAEIDPLWQELLRRHDASEPKFFEEAHSLSFIYHKLGYETGTADPFIKRIWTALLYRNNSTAEDRALTIWHLPTEKRFGLRRMFEEVKDPGSRFWTSPLGPHFIRYAGARLGIPHRSPRKTLLDVTHALREKIASGGVITSVSRAIKHNTIHMARGIRDRLRSAS